MRWLLVLSLTGLAACASGAGERRTQRRRGDVMGRGALEAGQGLLGGFGDGEEGVEFFR